LDIVKYLVENKADLTAEDNQALRWASEEGHFDIVKYLVENGADPCAEESEALVLAGEGGHLEIVKYLVENKADISSMEDLAISSASRNGELEVVKYLLENGADFSKLSLEHKNYFRSLKAVRRWRRKILLRRLNETALPLYYSPGFPGFLKGKSSLDRFVKKVKN